MPELCRAEGLKSTTVNLNAKLSEAMELIKNNPETRRIASNWATIQNKDKKISKKTAIKKSVGGSIIAKPR